MNGLASSSANAGTGGCGGVGNGTNNFGTGSSGVSTFPPERTAPVSERCSSSTGAVLATANSVASSSGIGSGSVSGSIPGTGSPIRGRGCPTGLPASMIGSCAGESMLRKSRSQGGKKLQKCLSTASYGEESSFTRPQMTPPAHNLLVTRQYCSFGSTTSNLKYIQSLGSTFYYFDLHFTPSRPFSPAFPSEHCIVFER